MTKMQLLVAQLVLLALLVASSCGVGLKESLLSALAASEESSEESSASGSKCRRKWLKRQLSTPCAEVCVANEQVALAKFATDATVFCMSRHLETACSCKSDATVRLLNTDICMPLAECTGIYTLIPAGEVANSNYFPLPLPDSLP